MNLFLLLLKKLVWKIVRLLTNGIIFLFKIFQNECEFKLLRASDIKVLLLLTKRNNLIIEN